MIHYVPLIYTEMLPISNSVTVFFSTTDNWNFDIFDPEFLLIILDSEDTVEESVQFPVAQARFIVPYINNETTDAFFLAM